MYSICFDIFEVSFMFSFSTVTSAYSGFTLYYVVEKAGIVFAGHCETDRQMNCYI